jgi:hypothetical protein
MIHARARWLEPIGQTVAFLAFSIQFFYVDPASYGALRAALDYQAVQIDELANKGGTEVGNAGFVREIAWRTDHNMSRIWTKRHRDHVLPHASVKPILDDVDQPPFG